jgi:hypothetical protein
MTAPRTAYGPHLGTPDENGHCTTCGLTEDDGRAEHEAQPVVTAEERAQFRAAANLPAPLTDGNGFIDVDRLRVLAPAVRDGLIAAMRSAATELRAARGTVVVPEDTYDLVRRLTAAEEVMRQWQQAFDAAAKEANALMEEEALTAIGGLPGYEDAPAGSLFVPDGQGRRIAVSPDWKPGDSTWDTDTLKAWIAEQTVADEARKPDPDLVMPGEEPGDVPLWTNNEAVSLIRDGLDRLTNLGTFSPGVKKLDALRKQLSERGRDSDAGIIRQVRSVGLRQYRGVKVTREDTK